MLVKITRITTQKRNKHRYNIYIDKGKGDEYGFSVDEDVLIKHHLRKGLELTNVMMDTLMKQDDLQKVYNQVIHYLSFRMRTQKEVYDYLRKKEVEEEQIEQIIDKLLNNNLLNDQEFAEMFVRTRMNTTSKGPGLIRQELRAKGVSSEIASTVLERFQKDAQIEKATKLVEKRLNRSGNHSFQKQLDQARAALMRNGFHSEVIQIVMDDMKDMKNDDEEWMALEHHAERLLRRHEGKLSGTELNFKIKEGLYRQGFTLSLIDQYLQAKY